MKFPSHRSRQRYRYYSFFWRAQKKKPAFFPLEKDQKHQPCLHANRPHTPCIFISLFLVCLQGLLMGSWGLVFYWPAGLFTLPLKFRAPALPEAFWFCNPLGICPNGDCSAFAQASFSNIHCVLLPLPPRSKQSCCNLAFLPLFWFSKGTCDIFLWSREPHSGLGD